MEAEEESHERSGEVKAEIGELVFGSRWVIMGYWMDVAWGY